MESITTRIRDSSVAGCNSAVLAEIFGTGPWTLGVEHKSGNNKSFALTYRATAATRADTYVFATRVTVGQVILPTTEQPVVTVTPGPADRFAVTGLVTAIAGAVQLATATALDAYGNVVTGYGGAAAITSSDVQAVLPGTGSFVNGVRSFFVSLATAGSQTVSATDGLVTGGQTVTITAAAASVMTLTGLADTTAAGASQSGFVTLFDAYSNVARGYAGTVHFTSSDVNATLPGDHTFVAADNGIYPFTGLVLKKVGSTSITVADTVTASLQAGTTETVSPGAAASLTLQWGDEFLPFSVLVVSRRRQLRRSAVRCLRKPDTHEGPLHGDTPLDYVGSATSLAGGGSMGAAAAGVFRRTPILMRVLQSWYAEPHGHGCQQRVAHSHQNVRGAFGVAGGRQHRRTRPD